MKKRTKTLKVRIKDRHAPVLRQMAGSVNTVWNYCNELSHRSILERGAFLSGYDLQKYTVGSSKLLGLNAATVQMVGHEYATRRTQFRKAKLAWRKTHGVRRSLGWIPFRSDCIKYQNGQIIHNGVRFGFWDSYGLADYQLGSGCFSEDSRGRWYFNVVVDVSEPKQTVPSKGMVGIDLGCKEAATTSDGEKLEGRRYRELEAKLGIAQRARNKKRVRNIHAKVKNRRLNDLHQFSTRLVRTNGLIVVGNVSSQTLVKTKMAKSVLDAGWGQLKTLLEYKCAHAGGIFMEVNEAYTTQSCSSCGELSANSPKGRAGLGIREWACECGVTHDRDINAARNILALGHGRLAGGIPHLNLSTG